MVTVFAKKLVKPFPLQVVQMLQSSSLKKIESKGFSLKLCYEACYLGFALYRELDAAGIHCDVVASNMIPSKPGDRVKTDRKDSEKLALLLHERYAHPRSRSYQRR